MALSFLSICSKNLIMPNQGNKSNGKSGVVQKKKTSTMPSSPQEHGNASATKHSRDENGKSASGSSGKGGSKTISDGNAND